MTHVFLDKNIPPRPFPPIWAHSWGQDTYGLWASLKFKGITQVMRWIRAGSFVMGSPEVEAGREGDEVQHKVTLTRGFWLAETACTQELWKAVMGNNPSSFRGNVLLPVEQISWHDCMKFLDRLNNVIDGVELRLPTDAQWEYACRGGTETPFPFGKTLSIEQVNYNGRFAYAGGDKEESREQTVEVKTFEPNPWGLYEMNGNVCEWCADYNRKYRGKAVADPKGPLGGSFRALRGGSWFSKGRYVRSASRNWTLPSTQNDKIGFRFSQGQ